MTATIDQLLDLHDRAKRLTDELSRFCKDAESCGLPGIELSQPIYQVGRWRKNHVLKAIGGALLRERNSREET